jgi:TetR/AcrR family transcriptional repressor of nem operon
VAEGAADGSLPGLDPDGTAQALYELWLGASLLTKVRRDSSALEAAMATTEALLGRP